MDIKKIRRFVDRGMSLNEIADLHQTKVADVYRVVRKHLTVETLKKYAAEGETPQTIADMYGVSAGMIYKQIRHLRLVYLFYGMLVGCRDVCPALVRLMAMSGANLHTIHCAAFPDITYHRLRRFIDRECMSHYFAEQILPSVVWIERNPPLFRIDDIANRVARNESPKTYELEVSAPTIRTVYKRLGVSNWRQAKRRAIEILEGEENDIA